MVVVPYARSGFRVGRAAAVELERHLTDHTVGVVLMNHGLFTFGSGPRQAYDRMIDLVTEAEDYLDDVAGRGEPLGSIGAPPGADRIDLASLRFEVSKVAGRPFIVSRHSDHESWAFSRRRDLEEVASQGPATPDHVIWTKTVPMFGSRCRAIRRRLLRLLRGESDRVGPCGCSTRHPA